MKIDSLTLSVPREHPCFAGHFPGNPLVPGALLTQWLIDALADEGVHVTQIRQLKFLLPVRPGACLSLSLSPAPRGSSLLLSASIDGQPALSGKLEADHGQ